MCRASTSIRLLLKIKLYKLIKKLRYDEWMNISKRQSAPTGVESLEIYNEKHVMETRNGAIFRIIKS